MADDDFIGVCTECKSDQPDQYVEKQLNMGWTEYPCKYCGGVAKVVRISDRDNALKQADRQRGL